MKFLCLLLLSSAFACTFLHAQDPAAPVENPLQSSTPLEEVPLIPEQVPQNEKPRGTAIEPRAPKTRKSKTSESAGEVLERIRFREARTKAERDAKVQAEWARSQTAKTELEKRDALKSYYKLLYGRMVKLDASLKKLIDQRQLISLRRLEQTRIDPTEPLDPHERAERFERVQQ
jgi:hypothetical protein